VSGSNGNGSHGPRVAHLPPVEAERVVLGSMMRDNACIAGVRRSLQSLDFSEDAHQQIFREAAALHEVGERVDTITVAEALKKKRQLTNAGGCRYLAKLWDSAPTSMECGVCVGIVREDSDRRYLTRVLNRGLGRADRDDPNELVQELRRDLDTLAARSPATPAGPAGSTSLEIDAEDLLASAVETDLEYLPLLGRDGYFVRGWSHLIAGYPRCGKTELLAACIPDWLRDGERVLYFTEEARDMWEKRLRRREGPWRGLQLFFALGVPAADLLARMTAGQESVVVADTIRNLGILPADENDNSAVAAALAPWVAGARQGAKTLMLQHHMRKGAGEHGEGISGGHALLGAVDMALEIRRENLPRRRTVRAYGRLVQPDDLLYELNDRKRLVALGDPGGVTLDETRRAVALVLRTEWLKTSEVLALLEEPRPGLETVRKALLAEARRGFADRDPRLGDDSPGKTARWRRAQKPPTG
jgi:hypothetical protein